jgi:hypothetical protein
MLGARLADVHRPRQAALRKAAVADGMAAGQLNRTALADRRADALLILQSDNGLLSQRGLMYPHEVTSYGKDYRASIFKRLDETQK